MKKLVIVVYDSKANSYSNPSVTDNIATAIRDFKTLVEDGRTLIGMHPEDFQVLSIGEYSNETGLFLAGNRLSIASGSDFVKPKE